MEKSHDWNARRSRGFFKLFRDIRRNPFSYLLLLPAALYVFVFSYCAYPYLLVAFEKYNYRTGIFGSPFVGFANFRFFFRSPKAAMVTGNTVFLNVMFLAFGTLFAVGFALLFNELRAKCFERFSKVSQTVMIFPNFISWVIISYILTAILSTDYGILNRILRTLNQKEVNWYAKAEYWPVILTIMRIWKDTGMNMIVYLAAATGIDTEIYESAQMDGANRWQQAMRITLPLLTPTICIMTLMSIGKIFNGDFGMIYALIRDNGALYSTTDVIDTYVFRALRKSVDPSQPMAVGLYQSALGFIMVYGSNRVTRRFFPEGALF